MCNGNCMLKVGRHFGVNRQECRIVRECSYIGGGWIEDGLNGKEDGRW